MVVNRAKALSRQIYGLRRMFERYVILKTSNKKIHKKRIRSFLILKVRLLYKIVILSNPLPCGTLSSVYKNSFFICFGIIRVWTGAFFLVLKNYGMWSCQNHGSRNPESGKVLVHNPSQYGWDFFREKNRILFFLKS